MQAEYHLCQDSFGFYTFVITDYKQQIYKERVQKGMVRRRMRLRDRLILYYVLPFVGGLAILALYSWYSSRNALIERTFHQLTSIREARAEQLSQYFAQQINALQVKVKLPELASFAIKLPNDSCGCLYEKHRMLSADEGAAYFLSCTSGVFRLDFQPDSLCYKLVNADIIENDTVFTGIQSERIVFGSDTSWVYGLMTGGESQSRLMLQIDEDAISEIMRFDDPTQGMGFSGESYVTDSYMTSRSVLRFRDTKQSEVITSQGVIRALGGGAATAIYPDYRGKKVFGAFAPYTYSGLNLVILVELDYDEAMAAVLKSGRNILIMSLIVLLAVLISIWLISIRISRPVFRLKEAANRIGAGDFSIRVDDDSDDEIGELSAAFNAMALKLAEMQEERRRSGRALFSSFLDGQEKERQRLSRELHDGQGQELIALRMKLESITDLVDEVAKNRIESVKSGIDRLLDEVRNISNNLLPPVLKEFGMVAAMRGLCQELSLPDSYSIRFECFGSDKGLNSRVQTYLYRIAQESLSNAVKYSESSEIQLSISITNHAVSLVVQDMGKGFIFDSRNAGQGSGLFNMRERARVLGGEFSLVSAPGKGTRIWVYLPLNREQIV